MAKKNASKKPAAPAKKASSGATPLVIAIVVAAVAIGSAIWYTSGPGKSAGTGATGTTATSAGSSASGAINIPAEEKKYLGRLLPAGYQEPSVAGQQTYTSTIQMTDITATSAGKALTVPVDSIVSSKIVYFEYTRADGQKLPMLAYVKPSGKLFVGVSYCLPCKGTKQRIEGGQMVCESCGTVRDLETGAGISGGCKLYPLDEVPATVSAGKVSVEMSLLDNWQPQPMDRKSGSGA